MMDRVRPSRSTSGGVEVARRRGVGVGCSSGRGEARLLLVESSGRGQEEPRRDCGEGGASRDRVGATGAEHRCGSGVGADTIWRSA